jgi:hypothetical protein
MTNRKKKIKKDVGRKIYVSKSRALFKQIVKYNLNIPIKGINQ